METLLSLRWLSVWRRNFLVWKKLAGESVLGNIIEPLLYLVGFGYGLGAMLPEVEGVKYIVFLASGTICYSTMLSASFEALYSGFARMHVQRTWDTILNAPLTLTDVVLGEWVWSASKAALSGTAVLLVATVLGMVEHWSALFLIPLAFLIGLAFAGMGYVMTAIAKSYDFFMYWFTLALTPQMLICGAFFPVTNLPPWLQTIASVLPLHHAIEIGRPLLLGRVPDNVALHVLVLLAYGVVGLALAMRLFKRRLLK